MTYIPTTWINGKTPAINATNLNKIETGLVDAHDDIATNLTAIALNTTHRGSDGTDHGHIDQDVQSTASPTFVGVVISDGGTIGQAAGPLLTFDDTNNFLEITGCNVGIGTATPSVALHVSSGGKNSPAIFESTDSISSIGVRDSADTAYLGTEDGKAFFGQSNSLVGGSNIVVDATGQVGIGEPDPKTLLELTSTVPYLTLHNSTAEDTDGGRESKLIFKGHQSGAEKTTLAMIQASHDGTADDQKGDLIFYTNDGSDGGVPTEAMRIDSNRTVDMNTGSFSFGGTAGDFTMTKSRDNNYLSLIINNLATSDASLNEGGAIVFQQNGYTSASIIAGKEGDFYPDGQNRDGYLAFQTRSQAGGTLEAVRIDSSLQVGIGTGAAPTALLDINSDILRLRTPKTPASSGAAGNQGDIAWDAGFIYVCTQTNQWERVAIATW